MIKLEEIRDTNKLEQSIDAICPQSKGWRFILEAEKEMEEAGNGSVIAYEILDMAEPVGLMQYTFEKAGFLHKEKLVIDILTLKKDSLDILYAVHGYLREQYQLSGQLIHVIQPEEENTEIHKMLLKDGFEEKKNTSGRIPKYGYEEGGLYFVKKTT